MNKPSAFFVVSEWNNDVSWIKDYTDDYIIFDKSNTLDKDEHVVKCNNVGYNIFDALLFCYTFYNDLPDVVAFLEGDPFSHCRKETFDKLIYNTTFTAIEDYSNSLETWAHKKDVDGGYMEINSGAYALDHIHTHGKETVRFFCSYNDLLYMIFKNPESPKYVRFAPGGQYIVTKENIRFYSRSFYKKLMGFVDYHRLPVEAMVIERALYGIFSNKFIERKRFKFSPKDHIITVVNPPAVFIISRYNENLDWVKDYTDTYVVYNKGEPIYNDPHILNTENIGGNQRDIFRFIYDNYDNLPEVMAFLQGNPFDHCNNETFYKLIYNTGFTCLESYGKEPKNHYEFRVDGKWFAEYNNNWYIEAQNTTWARGCKYASFDDFMNTHFTNYQHTDVIRFSPGSQYIIKKEQALHYPRKFWKKMMDELPYNHMAEGHIIERMLFILFLNVLEAKEC